MSDINKVTGHTHYVTHPVENTRNICGSPILRSFSPDAFCYFVPFAAATPVLLTPLKDATVEAGKALELTAAINVASGQVEAVWQKDSKPIDTNAKSIRASCHKGHCTLRIDSISPADAGKYSVILKNPSGSVTASSKITVKGFNLL